MNAGVVDLTGMVPGGGTGTSVGTDPTAHGFEPREPREPEVVEPAEIGALGHVGASAPTDGPLGIVDQLLRHRTALLDRIDRGEDLLALVRAMIATIAVCMILVGAAIGGYRGGAQIAYAAIKLPLVMLLTAALCAPTLTALNLALGRAASPTRDVTRVLTALAFGSLLLLAAAPIGLLARAVHLGYHATILVTVASFAVAGAASVVLLTRCVRRTGRRGSTAVVLGLVTVFVMVGSQMAWTLRPYVVRPRSQEIPFLRNLEGSLYDAVRASARSAMGVYDLDRDVRSGREGYVE